jgi:hypothetical protein
MKKLPVYYDKKINIDNFRTWKNHKKLSLLKIEVHNPASVHFSQLRISQLLLLIDV